LFSPLCLKIQESLGKETIFKNEEIVYTLIIKNNGPFFYPRSDYLFFNADLAHFDKNNPPPPALLPGEKSESGYNLKFPYRGKYNVGVELAVITDMFGLFKFTLKNKQPESLIVFPKANEGFFERIRDDAQQNRRGRNLFEEDYSVIADVRKYVSDDNLRKVHWKLSAKHGELMVKLFDPLDQEKAVLLLDTREIPLNSVQAMEFEDKVISYLSAAADSCAENGFTASIFAGGEESPVIRGDEFSYYTRMACIKFDDKNIDINSLPDLSGRHLFAFLTAIDEDTRDALKQRIPDCRGAFVYYFYSDALPVSDKTRALLDELEAQGAKVMDIIFSDGGET
jgi:uncharacterized protein (DUF58 family)